MVRMGTFGIAAFTWMLAAIATYYFSVNVFQFPVSGTLGVIGLESVLLAVAVLCIGSRLFTGSDEGFEYVVMWMLLIISLIIWVPSIRESYLKSIAIFIAISASATAYQHRERKDAIERHFCFYTLFLAGVTQPFREFSGDMGDDGLWWIFRTAGFLLLALIPALSWWREYDPALKRRAEGPLRIGRGL